MELCIYGDQKPPPRSIRARRRRRGAAVLAVLSVFFLFSPNFFCFSLFEGIFLPKAEKLTEKRKNTAFTAFTAGGGGVIDRGGGVIDRGGGDIHQAEQ